MNHFPQVFKGDPAVPLAVEPQKLTTVPGERPKIQRRVIPSHKKQEILELLSTFVDRDWLRLAGVSQGVDYAAPVIAVRKPEGGWRLTWDFREVNKWMQSEYYPMPLPLAEMREKLRGCTRFGKADLAKAFWQIPLDEESGRLAAVRCDDRIYYPRRVPQGLKVAPQICQRVLVGILRGSGEEEDLLDGEWGKVLVYVDDILLGAETSVKLRELWKRVLARFATYRVQLNQDKCVFDAAEVTYVGRLVSAEGIRGGMEVGKGLDSLKVPKTERELGELVWGWNHFRDFIPGFASLMAPARHLLTSIQQKRQSLRKPDLSNRRSWSDSEHSGLEDVIHSLVEVIQAQMVLAFPDPTKRFFILSDASDIGWGALIGQMDEGDGPVMEGNLAERHPELLHCVSGLWPEGQEWSTNRREAFAVVEGLKAGPFLQDSLKPVWVMCDNSSIVGMFNSDGERTSQARQAVIRLREEACEYNIEMYHIPGRLNVLADYLSRPRKISQVSQADGQEQHIQELGNAEAKDRAFATARRIHVELGHSKGPILKMRLNRELGAVDMQAIQLVDKYCLRCQMTDRRELGYYGLGMNELFREKAECLHLDLKATKDPLFPFLLVVVDHFTAKLWLQELSSKEPKVVLAKLRIILEQMEMAPKKLFSDKGVEFHGVLGDWCKAQGLEQKMCVPRAPWSNGRVERKMSEIIKVCTGLLTEGHSPEWRTLLRKVEQELNGKALQSLDGFTPDEVWNASLPDVNWGEVYATIFDRRHTFQLQRAVKEAHKFHKFVAGDLIWVSKSYWNNRVGAAGNAQLYEMVPKWVGPWRIVQVLEGGYSVEVERAYAWKQKRRGRRLADKVTMNVRYVKPLYCLPEDLKELQRIGSKLHEKLFGW